MPVAAGRGTCVSRQRWIAHQGVFGAASRARLEHDTDQISSLRTDENQVMEPLLWPALSVASALLQRIRRELLQDARAPERGHGAPIDVCAIVEDGLCGYELVPHSTDAPFLIVGCRQDGIARVRRTVVDPARHAGLRLATLHGRAVNMARPRVRRTSQHAEILYADWTTAAGAVWDALAPALRDPGAQWDHSMADCRSLESALAVAALHLAEWDPAVDFCGLVHQAEYGLPLRSREGGFGTLTLQRPDLWLLRWRAGQTIVQREFSPFSTPEGTPALLPRDARGW